MIKIKFRDHLIKKMLPKIYLFKKKLIGIKNLLQEHRIKFIEKWTQFTIFAFFTAWCQNVGKQTKFFLVGYRNMAVVLVSWKPEVFTNQDKAPASPLVGRDPVTKNCVE